ncbi:conjugal transfer protein TrbM [Helicobacter pullorum]|uniref:TrbM/KikA/MpfK family conjugal transfer protein n=1 Tax=Helicobacter pullorum TaxID=35818 RepID=UPI000816A677|nr:TrbM/KikA/MpfK family conjugal transfer protein [Helicobacter pullorum]OCR03149.1 conjugal transfer protein TrbM [Helicobacter pullorum]OCR06118.1 conjugal transfer protein TrbM [Helicobacter pullorum]OCR08398.1 conjugal transfer protein TrbM [Helicobacter pullorum]OCR12262.1 conjugal transfer protein TrbM [Helicobacter pullorum]
MKKAFLSIFSLSLLISIETQAQELTGDTKLACEAILCLSSGTRPSECNPALNRFYSISAKKISDTIKKRRNFLNLCPVSYNDDLVLRDLTQNVLPASNPEECKPNYLNRQIETKQVFSNSNKNKFFTRYYRVNPNIPNHCNILFQHSYTDYQIPKYNCTGEFYSQLEWNLSAKLTPISFQEFLKLDENQKYSYTYSCGSESTCISYNRKTPFNKQCWSY